MPLKLACSTTSMQICSCTTSEAGALFFKWSVPKLSIIPPIKLVVVWTTEVAACKLTSVKLSSLHQAGFQQFEQQMSVSIQLGPLWRWGWSLWSAGLRSGRACDSWAGPCSCCTLPLSQAETQGLGELRFKFCLQQMCSEEPAQPLTDRALDALFVQKLMQHLLFWGVW